MKVGMILGIIGGVIALCVGAIGYSITSTVGSLSASAGHQSNAATMQFYSIMSIVLPIVGIVGSGIVARSHLVGAALMGVSAVGILLVFGFGMFSIVPAILLAVGAGLVLMEKKSQNAA
jgi:hypothetical protein